MSQKRKPSTSITTSQKTKIARTTENTGRRFKTAPEPVSAEEEELLAEDEDAFEGFGSDDQDESGSEEEATEEESDDDDDDDVEQEEGDDLDHEGADEQEMDGEETVDGTNEEENNSTAKTGTVKEVPAHAAQRVLAKERKLSRPNGTPSTLPLPLRVCVNSSE
jgi:cell division protein FtsN